METQLLPKNKVSNAFYDQVVQMHEVSQHQLLLQLNPTPTWLVGYFSQFSCLKAADWYLRERGRICITKLPKSLVLQIFLGLSSLLYHYVPFHRHFAFFRQCEVRGEHIILPQREFSTVQTVRWRRLDFKTLFSNQGFPDGENMFPSSIFHSQEKSTCLCFFSEHLAFTTHPRSNEMQLWCSPTKTE